MVLDMQNECGMPFVDDQDQEALPKPVLSVLIVKAEADPEDCSFFSAFHLAFHELTCSKKPPDNKARVNFCMRVIANVGKSHPMCCHVISPRKGKRRPSAWMTNRDQSLSHACMSPHSLHCQHRSERGVLSENVLRSMCSHTSCMFHTSITRVLNVSSATCRMLDRLR